MLASALTTLILLLSVSGNPITNVSDLEQRSDVDVMCYNECYGVERELAIDAINWLCTHFAGSHLYYNAVEGDLAVTGHYFYTPKPNLVPGYIEEGEIWMSMGYFFNGAEKAMVCRDFYDGYDVNYNDCFSGLTSAIDNCNTGGENWKQGGRFRSTCFQYYFNPNPDEPCPYRWQGQTEEGV